MCVLTKCVSPLSSCHIGDGREQKGYAGNDEKGYNYEREVKSIVLTLIHIWFSISLGWVRKRLKVVVVAVTWVATLLLISWMGKWRVVVVVGIVSVTIDRGDKASNHDDQVQKVFHVVSV